ncbi:MAG: hypothetical protein HQL28_01945 [Candidatus Omnitrophica bacterium]|nr:hypothetical protein [Candidatus Omnitrophota bacterium]
MNKWLTLDPLGIFFWVVIAIVSLPSAIFSIDYLKTSKISKRLIMWLVLLVFVGSMTVLVVVNNALLFLVFWEIMAFSSYFLVVSDTSHEKTVRAGTIYITMTQLGTVFLTAGLLIIFKYSNSFDFWLMHRACTGMPHHIKNLVFILFLLGFGTKAGIVPLHLWLPYAHPAAPSHVSSIMSGVMIKMAVYGLLRFVFYILGIDSLWWGVTIIILGLISSLVGIIYALMDKDIKRLLAYSSIENIGVIFMSLGLSAVFTRFQMPYFAVLALIACLYHLINHAIFKSLLFLCAGSVYTATSTKDIEKMGGLIKKMPYTSACFLIGAMAIAALPPLNGFVSEWLTLQAFFTGSAVVTNGYKLFFGMCAAMLALTSALAAACFVKAFGITFLAKPRSRHAENALEVPTLMRTGMIALSCMIPVFGLGSIFILPWLSGIAGYSSGFTPIHITLSSGFSFVTANPGAKFCFSPIAMFLIFSLIAIAAGFLYLCRGSKKERSYNTWDCGYYTLGSRNEYTGTAFSKPFRLAFSFFLLPYRKTQKVRESFYFVKTFSYETYTTKVFKKYIYQPALNAAYKIAFSMRRIQPGSIHLYLAYIVITAVILVAFMRKL